MESTDPIDIREAEIAKIARSKEDVTALWQEVAEITEGTAFKGSHRSGQFLKYIIEQAIEGNFDALKERVIGMELFGRSASYDTGEDAIVRVTASDVRKRLLQHYGKYGVCSEFRLSLPLGSYIPEIKHEPRKEPARVDVADVNQKTATAPPNPSTTLHDSENASQAAVASPRLPNPEAIPNRLNSWRRWLSMGLAFMVVLNLGLWILFWSRTSQTDATSATPFPWVALFHSSHATQLISSDPNIAEIQGFTGGQISVSDYANHNYLTGPNKLTPDEDRFCRIVLRGDKSTTVDTQIAVNVAQLAQSNSRNIAVHGARDIQLSDLKTDDNFIFLGSPRSNPWSSIFTEQLDFRFAFDKDSGSEFIRNIHPRTNELSAYVPTAPGWATGRSFAIIALVQNPDQNGQVLLLAGATGEGTAAAGKLVTDLPRFSSTLQKCGVSPSGAQQHFELLLQLNTMAGSPSNVDVVACHLLPDVSAQKL